MTARAFLIIAMLLISGCGEKERPQVVCMKQALQQPELHSGRVVFGRLGGQPEVVSAGGLFAADTHAELPMASLTKPLVADQVRKAIARGDFQLSTPFADLLPRLRIQSSNQKTTVRQLLQHQGGFDRSGGDPLFANDPPSCALAAADVAFRPPEVQPGNAVMYSNAGYCLLGQVLLEKPQHLSPEFRAILSSPLGAAGGWRATLPAAYATYQALLPVRDLPSTLHLEDGSHYAYGWRWDPALRVWMHFGRLPGMLSLAVTDGSDRLLLAYFDGDPVSDTHSAALAAKAMWPCMSR
ncbi:beta-lactamase family protein [Stenotrophomonas sp. S48]|uniref:serine hydrolase domain-containing protein n=1 Tax=unclassified Stenotrophomonas TaxID=196198 RepID=UPI0019013EDA|nr:MULTISPECIES: serine hydrolase domain-containing protein [unclassified Stenotrophomonas]MBK0025557.1 beta-lactamase family protein [Stenotrophomonas sp. S48]MBK0047589.1 beta-lactamase family protein [Stenotrophomonas sp. S49]